MKRNKIASAIAGVCLFAFSTGALAQQTGLDVPRTISYQGMLTSNSGSPLPDGTHSVTVTLYTDPAGTIPLWQDRYDAPTSGGVFNLYLGSNTPLPSPEQMNRPLWVGTSINGQEEMRPLTPLTASPYALNLPDRAVTTGKLAAGAVTADKVDMNYVAGFRINGQEVAGKGTVLDIRSSNDIALEYDEANQALSISRRDPAATGDAEKGARVLGTDEDAWGARGDLLDPGTHAHVTADNNDWIGTQDSYNFTIRVDDANWQLGGTGGVGRVMQYIPNTESANILGGYFSNTIGTGTGNIIAGGGFSANPNHIFEECRFGVISGGANNRIGQSSGIIYNPDYATIGGGFDNYVGSPYSTIGGGEDNNIDGLSIAWSVIAGGHGNHISSIAHGFIGGGHYNFVGGESSTVAGGYQNDLNAQYGFIGGGYENSITGDTSVIGGGSFNVIESKNSTIGGGSSNSISSNGSRYSTISGGNGNKVGAAGDPARYATVGGGWSNVVYADSATIAGGRANIIENGVPNSFIGGGRGNKITVSTDPDVSSSVITGGRYNTIGANTGLSTIGGGSGNNITAHGSIGNPNFLHATIPGGDNLKAQSWAQTVVGGYNLPKGSVPSRVVGGGNRKDPILIVGAGYDNGTSMTRFNAFEVSYNGHSTVYHTNGTGAATPAIRGTTYTDNTIYAWAYAVPVSMGPGVGTVSVQCDFGVMTIQYVNTGEYLVKMNLEKPNDNGTFSPVQLNCGSVTANIVHEGRTCALINTSPISASSFRIYISSPQCVPIDLPFTFKVTARP